MPLAAPSYEGGGQKRRSSFQPEEDNSDDGAAMKHRGSTIEANLAAGDEEEAGPTVLAENKYFSGFIMGCIILNAIQMGLELQFDDGIWKTIWGVLEQFFTGIFLIEMLVKWWSYGPKQYFMMERANWLDFVVVVVAVVEKWILVWVFTEEDLEQVGFIAVLRIIRLSRILKLLRAKRELMMLMEGIIGSMKSMGWLGLLLGILIYTVAICFVKFIGRSGAYPKDEFDCDFYFGDMLKASVTGLNLALMSDWGIFRPILKRQPLFALFVGAYVGVASFGLMNAIIGVIVTRTGAAAAEAAEEDKNEYQSRQMEFVDSLQDIIYEIDTDGDGTVTPDEMAAASGNAELMETLSSIDLPASFSLLDLHCMLDKDGDGELTKKEFGQGMRRLIFSNDFQNQCLMMLAIAQQKRKLYEVRCEMDECFADIKSKLDKLLSGGFGAGGGGGGGGVQNCPKCDKPFEPDQNVCSNPDCGYEKPPDSSTSPAPGGSGTGNCTINVQRAIVAVNTGAGPEFNGDSELLTLTGTNARQLMDSLPNDAWRNPHSQWEPIPSPPEFPGMPMMNNGMQDGMQNPMHNGMNNGMQGGMQGGMPMSPQGQMGMNGMPMQMPPKGMANMNPAARAGQWNAMGGNAARGVPMGGGPIPPHAQAQQMGMPQHRGMQPGNGMMPGHGMMPPGNGMRSSH